MGVAASDDIADLQELVEQWGQEFALERELAGLGEADDETWIDLAEAERRADVSRSTLRTWYRSGQIASRLVPGPHGLQRLVPLDAVLTRAARSPRTTPRAADATPQEDPPVSATTTPDAVIRLAELATSAATDRALAAEARAAEAESALRSALERAAAAEAELRLLRPPG